MRYAVTDIGSNTVRINIYDVIEKEDNTLPGITKIMTECRSLGLLNYERERTISDEGIFTLVDTLSAFDTLTKNVLCDRCFYFATASLRSINNTNDVIAIVKERVGITIEIISGETEALLSFSGLKLTFGDKIASGLMIDMGGGSTEIIGFVDGLPVRALSLPFGSLSLYRKFVSEIFPTKGERKSIKKFTDENASKVCWLNNYGDTAYLVGGTARTFGHLRDIILRNGTSDPICRMTYDELAALYAYLKKPDSEIIKILLRTAPERIHTIVPGICSFIRILKFGEISNIVISPTGIREGYLSDRVIKSDKI